jgi:hypothetical protein
VKASKMFNVLKVTLKYYVNNRAKEVEAVVTARTRREPVLPVRIENEIMNYCFRRGKRFFRANNKRHKKMVFS